jgi:hypothetical protein
MNDPRRLRDEDNDITRALLRAGRPWAPRPARQRAIAAATSIVATTGVTATAAGGALAKAGAVAALKWMGIAGVVAATGVGAAVAFRSDGRMLGSRAAVVAPSGTTTESQSRSARPAPVGAFEPTGTTNPLSPSEPVLAAASPIDARPATPPANIESPSQPRSSSASVRAPGPRSPFAPAAPPPPASLAKAVAAQVTGPEAIAEEASVLGQVNAAITAGAPARALSLLDGYTVRFPNPSLGAEAQVLRIEALARSGDAITARRVGDAFLAANPQSPYRARVRGVLQTNP